MDPLRSCRSGVFRQDDRAGPLQASGGAGYDRPAVGMITPVLAQWRREACSYPVIPLETLWRSQSLDWRKRHLPELDR